MSGFVIGSLIALFAGAWVYRTAKRRLAFHEAAAAIVSGLATTVAATLVYIPFHVHEWLGGAGTSWGASAFMGLCLGLTQGVLFRGRPLEPRV